MDFRPTVYNTKDWTNLIKLTLDKKLQIYGYKNPSVFFTVSTGISMLSAVNGKANYVKCFKAETPKIGKWTDITIGQEKIGKTYEHRIQIDGKEVFSVENI